jgi:hypothetical protein
VLASAVTVDRLVALALGFVFPAFMPSFVARFLLTIHVGVGIKTDLAIGAGATFLAGTVWAVVFPERGLQDRIAGTWLVPR